MKSALDLSSRIPEGVLERQDTLYDLRLSRCRPLGRWRAEFYKLPTAVRLDRQFDKWCRALYTPWNRTLAQIEGAIIPSLAIKSFKSD